MLISLYAKFCVLGSFPSVAFDVVPHTYRSVVLMVLDVLFFLGLIRKIRCTCMKQPACFWTFDTVLGSWLAKFLCRINDPESGCYDSDCCTSSQNGVMWSLVVLSMPYWGMALLGCMVSPQQCTWALQFGAVLLVFLPSTVRDVGLQAIDEFMNRLECFSQSSLFKFLWTWPDRRIVILDVMFPSKSTPFSQVLKSVSNKAAFEFSSRHFCNLCYVKYSHCCFLLTASMFSEPRGVWVFCRSSQHTPATTMSVAPTWWSGRSSHYTQWWERC